MTALSLDETFPRLMRSVSRGLNKYGDGLLFGAVGRTPPIAANPHAETGIHSAVPHRYLFAYLTAIKSFLQYHADVAVYVHDDGSLREEDKTLIRFHVPGARIVDRAWADQAFADQIGDEFLMKVRKSYTSYLKLFDPSLVSPHKRIAIVDTDVLFLSRPATILDWVQNGGAAWYHRSGAWLKSPASGNAGSSAPQPNVGRPTHIHIQQMVVQQIPEINQALRKDFAFVHGFNSGFIGYDRGMVDYAELKELLIHLFTLFGDRIFRWGSEQTMHGLVLCGKGATALPSDEYMVYTNLNSEKAAQSTFVHFIGEFRYHRLLYPRLAAKVIRNFKH